MHKNTLALFCVFVSALLLVVALIVAVRQVQTKSATPSATIAKILPRQLNSSEQLLQTLAQNKRDIADVLHQEADQSDFALDEISYETRIEPDLPLVARNASFTLTNNYQHIRTLLDHLIHQHNNMTLSALDCTKDEIDATDVHCSITLTAFQPRSTMTGEHVHVP